MLGDTYNEIIIYVIDHEGRKLERISVVIDGSLRERSANDAFKAGGKIDSTLINYDE